MKKLRIIYMGTPDFAVKPLSLLVEEGYNIVGVVTMPDKPAGRGMKLQASPVKQYAEAHGLRLLQPEKLKDETFLSELAALNADLQIVVAFRMLPEAVWNMPRLGTFNLHASLLPQYRGAAPINWAVINGEKETGITTFFLTHEIDTGKIIQQELVPILDTDNAGTVHDKLMEKGAGLVLETVQAIESGSIKPLPQELLYNDENDLKPAPKIYKETCKIQWDNDAVSVYNFIRGLSPYPAAWSDLTVDGEKAYTAKILEAEKELAKHNDSTGVVRSDGKSYFKVAVRDGYIHIQSIQLSGKKRLNIADFLRGFNFTAIKFH